MLGIPEVMVERALPFLTVYRGQPQINILDAAPQVLAALPGMNPDCSTKSCAARAGAAAECRSASGAARARQQLGDDSGSKALRVTARIAFDSGQRMTSEAVIFVLDGGGEPYRVLTWRDDIDDAPADHAAGVTR